MCIFVPTLCYQRKPQELQDSRGSRLHSTYSSTIFSPILKLFGPYNPLRKLEYLWTMLYGLTNLIAGAGKVSAVFTVAHIFRAKSNFSRKNMTRQGALGSIGSEKVWCIISVASTLPRHCAFSSMAMRATTPLTSVQPLHLQPVVGEHCRPSG